jgi:hypothetical protein
MIQRRSREFRCTKLQIKSGVTEEQVGCTELVKHPLVGGGNAGADKDDQS